MVLELILDVFSNTILKASEDFIENYLFKNSDYFEIDEDGEKRLNSLGTVAVLYFIENYFDKSKDELLNLLKDKDFIRELFKDEEV